MRFRATLFDRSYASLPVGDLTGPDRGEAGADGEEWLKGLLGGGPDINPELTGRAKHRVYDEMRKTDATVKSLLFMPTLTVRSARWLLDPADERDPVSKAIRDLVAENLGLGGHLGWLNLSWPKQLEQGLSMLPFGACVEELVWGDARVWRDADGDEHLVRPLAKLALRPTVSIDRFEWADDGTPKRVTQNLPNVKPMPGDKVSYMTFEREGNHWDGVSLLRPAWGAWTLKKFLIIHAGIGWDRFAMGIPKLFHPDTPEGVEVAKEIGRSLRGHQRAYLRFPVPPGGGKEDSEWDAEIMSAAASLADPVPLLRWCSEQIAEAGLQHFSRQGLGQTGARATAETQANPFYLACEALAEDLRYERMRQVIRRIVQVNFGVEAAERRCPVLRVSKIKPRDIDTVAKAVGILDAAGFMLNDRAAQDDVREELGLGKLPNDLDSMGVDRERLRQLLAQAGLDEETLALVVNALPDDVGVARNRVGREGDGLAE